VSPVRHMCGCILERGEGRQGTYYMRVLIDDERTTLMEAKECPQCHDTGLCDTDMTDLEGRPLYIPEQTESVTAP
jgi:hypothetical protein